MPRTTIVMAAALVFAAALPAAPAQAQSIRTFVSTAGVDNATCSLASPCRHFPAAVAATAVGGEVDALDAGAYGSFTISHAISIEGQGWSYVAPPAGGAAITINAVSGNVNIRGVSLNGVGVAGATGIQFNSGTSLNVQNSVIRNFSADGILFQPNSSNPSQLFVSNTLISDNGGNAIDIYPVGSGTVNGVLDHVNLENNVVYVGLYLSNVGGPINVNVNDSVIANNTTGILADQGTGQMYVAVRRSDISNNGTGVWSNNGAGIIRLTQSVITGNATGWTTSNGGSVGSTFDNLIDDNAAGNGNPPTLSYK